MNVKKGVLAGIIFAAIVMGVLAMQRALPEKKSERIYKEIAKYSPYYMEKTIGGLSIIDKRDNRKEKPSAADVMHRMDELQATWGKEHLRVENSDLIILGENNQTIVKIFIKDQQEREFLQHFYGI
jgi:hypothetical protein